MYLWWSLYTLYLHACQVRVTLGDSGLCCCACATSVEPKLTPLCLGFAPAFLSYVHNKTSCVLILNDFPRSIVLVISDRREGAGTEELRVCGGVGGGV